MTCAFVILISLSIPVNAINLPPEAQRDLHVVELSELLKAESWEEAYPLFEKIDKINKQHKFKPSSSVIFYAGEVAFFLKKYDESEAHLVNYIRKAGSEGKFYRKSLQMLNDLEPKLADFYSQKSLNLMGRGVRKANSAQALKYWLKAMEYGYDGANVLGRSYQLGGESSEFPTFHVKQDYAKAIKWYQKGADTKYKLAKHAIHELAKMHLNGLGVSKNIQKAIKLLEKAIKLGNGESYFYLGKIYERGNGVSVDIEKAISIYKKGANKKYGMPTVSSQYALSKIYLHGDMKYRNLDKGVEWLKLAANEKVAFGAGQKTSYDYRGNANASYEMALMYLNGIDGVKKDEIKAFKLLSYSPWSVEEYLALSNLYLNGVGTSKNHEKAKEMLLKALKKKKITAQQKEQVQKALVSINSSL